jgi:hypothetical protein
MAYRSRGHRSQTGRQDRANRGLIRHSKQEGERIRVRVLLLTDFVEKGDSCDAGPSMIQSLREAGPKIMMGHRNYANYELRNYGDSAFNFRITVTVHLISDLISALSPYYRSRGRRSQTGRQDRANRGLIRHSKQGRDRIRVRVLLLAIATFAAPRQVGRFRRGAETDYAVQGADWRALGRLSRSRVCA